MKWRDRTVFVFKLTKSLMETSSFDLIVLPGGMPGSVHLRDSESLITELQRAVASGKSVAAIAAPIVLDKAGLLDSRHYTCFPGKKRHSIRYSSGRGCGR